jgi:hypothetical protein
MLGILFSRFENITNEEEKSRAIRDAMHLATHHMHKRDFFVTNKQQQLESSSGLLLNKRYSTCSGAEKGQNRHLSTNPICMLG